MTSPRCLLMQSTLAVSFCTLGTLACDSSYGSFLDVVPIENQNDDPVHVYLAIDGMSRAAFDAARQQGAFTWLRDSDLIGYFPAVSDYSWTRMLRAEPMAGQELQYFDPDENQIHNQGLRGVAEHPLKGGLLDPLPVYRKFDFLGDGSFWQYQGYSDPEAALPTTLDAMFSLLASRARWRNVLLVYLMNVDVASHRYGFQSAVTMLVEIDRRLVDFKARHPGRFQFTIFADHGNAHQRAELVDPRQLLQEVGILPVDSFGDGVGLQVVPIVHVRVNFVSIHTRPGQSGIVAARTSRHRWVDLAVARDEDCPCDATFSRGFALWREGRAYRFQSSEDGSYRIMAPGTWIDLGIDLGIDLASSLQPNEPALVLTGAQALQLTAAGPYPDLFYRVASAFAGLGIRHVPDVILSMPDNVTSFGFHIPGSGDSQAVHGFHGALTRGSALSVVATEVHALPPVLRADQLLDAMPELASHMRGPLREPVSP